MNSIGGKPSRWESIGGLHSHKLGNHRHKKRKHDKTATHDPHPANHGGNGPPPVNTVRIEPAPDDDDKYAAEQNYRGRQLRIAKILNWITAAGTLVGLLGLLYLFGTLKATEKSADAAKDSVDLARKNAHFEQRAWLGISFGTYKYVVGQPFGAVVHVLDNGKTPARRVNGTMVTRFLKVGDKVPDFGYHPSTHVDLGTMLPVAPQDAISWLISPDAGVPPITPMKITKPMRDALKAGQAYVMVYGTLSYDSVFGAHHSLNFCAATTEVEFSGPKECIDYNDVDSRELPSNRRQQDEP